jgi:hypothetical protein
VKELGRAMQLSGALCFIYVQFEPLGSTSRCDAAFNKFGARWSVQSFLMLNGPWSSPRFIAEIEHVRHQNGFFVCLRGDLADVIDCLLLGLM